MEWQDEGVVLGTRKHGETSVILELMTPSHGRHLGLARGGRSRRMQPVLQPGNCVRANWRARLDEHLGQYQIEPLDLRAANLMVSAVGTFGIQTLAAHLRLLPERDAHRHLYDALNIIIENLTEPAIAAELMVRFEIALLDDLGFGLDLSRCAGGGNSQNLKYVSPKSGRAVSAEMGAPYAEKMLALPSFLQNMVDDGVTQKIPTETRALADKVTITDGFALTRYFLNRHVYEPRGIEPPDERAGFISAINKSLDKEAAQ